MPSKLTGRRVHPIRPKFLPTRQDTTRPTAEGGVRFKNNLAGRMAYEDLKQQKYAEQQGLCAHCNTYMSLANIRLTGGDWKESGQQRNDSSAANLAVHKRCLRPWHQAHAAGATTATATKATLGEIATMSDAPVD